MDFYRRSAGISKTQHVTNEEVRWQMKVEGNILYTIQNIRYTAYTVWSPAMHEQSEMAEKNLGIDTDRKEGRPQRTWECQYSGSNDSKGTTRKVTGMTCENGAKEARCSLDCKKLI